MVGHDVVRIGCARVKAAFLYVDLEVVADMARA